MVIKTDIELNNIDDGHEVYLRRYNGGEVFQGENVVNKENFSNGNIDIYNILSENNLLSNNTSLNLSFEVRDVVDENFLISDVNRARDELAFDYSDLNNSEFTDIVERLSSYNEEPLYVGIGEERSLVINVVSYRNQKIVFVLNDRNSALSRGENVEVYYSLYQTGIENFILSEQQNVEPSVVLTNHRKRNLTNYDGEDRKEQNKEKTYKELSDEIEQFTKEDYINLKQELNYNFEEFSNHVRFGSAYSKLVNADEKMQNIQEYQDQLDNGSSLSSGSKKNIKDNIRDIIDNFTLYEQYYHDEIYEAKTDSDYQVWLSSRKEDAELYDLQNEEFILYLFPPEIIEGDETGYFTNFVLLMGEFFDNIWLYIESLSNIKEKNFYSDFQISSKFVDDALREMGINKEVKFTESSLNDYFTGTDNLQKVSEIISRRLLYNLPFMYKSKGTISVIKQLINVFGVPEGLLDIYEFGSTKTGVTGTQFYNDYEWYLDVESNDEIILSITDSDISIPHTFEFMINNINTDGRLYELNADNYAEIESSGSMSRLNIYNNNALAVQTDYFINEKNDEWTYISISRDSNESGSIYSWQQDKTGYGITNAYSSSFDWNSGSYGTINDINILNNVDASITEFRLYDTVLNKRESESHADDFRSIAEEDYPETLNGRFRFYKPDGSSYDTIYATEGIYSASLSTSVSEDNFKIDEFFNYSRLKYIPSEDGRDKNVRIEDRVNTAESLTRFTRTTDFEYQEFSNDSNVLGVFISPTDKLNETIVRRIGDYVDLIPSDTEDSRYRFSNLEENKKYLSEVSDSFSNMYIYNSLLQIFNQRIFNLLKDFVPASSQLEYGLLIKNHILNKVRGYTHKKSAEAHRNYEITIDNGRGFNNNEIQNNYSEVNTIVSRKTATYQFDNVNLEDRDNLVLVSDESDVHVSIKNPSGTTKNFYTERIIRGFHGIPPDPDEIETLQNAGASILVT